MQLLKGDNEMNDSDSPDVRELSRGNLKRDPWQKVRAKLVSFRPKGCDEQQLDFNIHELESIRIEHIRALMKHILGKGYKINVNTSPGRENDFGIKHPFKDRTIVFPKHIMTPDSDEDIRGQSLIIRRDIPILYLLACFAHEATHLDRYFSMENVRKMTDAAEEKIEKGVPVVDAFGYFPYQQEQFYTDVDAFFLLKELGTDVEPANYCTYVSGGSLMQQETYDEILRRLQDS